MLSFIPTGFMIYGILIHLAAHSPFLNTTIRDLHVKSQISIFLISRLPKARDVIVWFSFGKKQLALKQDVSCQGVWSNVLNKGVMEKGQEFPFSFTGDRKMVGWKEWPGCPERMLWGTKEQETGGSLMLVPGI